MVEFVEVVQLQHTAWEEEGPFAPEHLGFSP